MPEDDAELRKQITAILDQTTAPVIHIDNVSGILRSSTLAGFLTSRRWDDRRLGVTEMVSRSNDRLWLFTGNNVRIGGDLPRRTVTVVIDPRIPNPERRTGFAITDLEGWTVAHRGELLCALLTMIRAWVVAGRPLGVLSGSDGYSTWTRTVRGILFYAGVQGTFDHDETRLEVGSDDDDWSEFLEAIAGVFGGDTWTVRELLDLVDTTEGGVDQARPLPLDSLPAQLVERVEKAHGATRAIVRPLGNWLHNREGRWAGPRTVRLVGRDVRNTSVWRVETYGSSGPASIQDHQEPGTAGTDSGSSCGHFDDTNPAIVGHSVAGRGSAPGIGSGGSGYRAGSGWVDQLAGVGGRACSLCGRSFVPVVPARAVCDACQPHLTGTAGGPDDA